jgi:outer membrane protein TolC
MRPGNYLELKNERESQVAKAKRQGYEKGVRDAQAKVLPTLESAWQTITKHAGQCWDSLDELEAAISGITGEKTDDVSRRLYRKYFKKGAKR